MASANGKCVACLNYSVTTDDQTTASDPDSTDWNDSCFYSVLRAIYGITKFTNWLNSDHEHKNVCTLQTCIICTIADLSHIIDPTKNEGQLVRNALQRIRSDYRPHSNDCYHFMDCLLKSMERSFTKRFPAAEYFEKIQLSARQLFCGSTCFSVKCLSCQHNNIRDNDCRVLDMNLTESSTINDNISETIIRQFAPERIVQCGSCSRDLQAKEELSFERLPDVLCIRGRANGDINIQTQFSQEIDLSRFCLGDNTDTKLQYRLASMVIQSELGQYTTMLYNGEGSYRECFQFQDRPITNDCMIDVKTFVVFYELNCPPTGTNNDFFNDSYEDFFNDCFDDCFDDSIYIKAKPNVVKNDVNIDDHICDTDDDDYTEDIKMNEINAQSTILCASESKTSCIEDSQSNVAENGSSNDCTEDIQMSERNTESAVESQNSFNEDSRASVADNDLSNDCTEDIQMSERNAESAIEPENSFNEVSRASVAENDLSNDCTEDIQMSERNAESAIESENSFNEVSRASVAENDWSNDCTEDIQMSERNAESSIESENRFNEDSRASVAENDLSNDCTEDIQMSERNAESTIESKNSLIEDSQSNAAENDLKNGSTQMNLNGINAPSTARSTDQTYVKSSKHFVDDPNSESSGTNRTVTTVYFRKMSNNKEALSADTQYLQEHFKQFGTIKRLLAGRSYGSVNFDNPDFAAKAIVRKIHKISKGSRLQDYKIIVELKDNWEIESLGSTTSEGENTQGQTNVTEDEESGETETTNNGENTQGQTNVTEYGDEDEESGEDGSIIEYGLHSTTNDGENTQGQTYTTEDEDEESGENETTNNGENTQDQTNVTEDEDEESGEDDSIIVSGLHSTTNDGENTQEQTYATEDEDEESGEDGSIIESGLHSTTNDGENTQEQTYATEDEDEESGEDDSTIQSGLHSTINNGGNTQGQTYDTEDEEPSETDQETMSVTKGNVYEKFSIDSTLEAAQTTHILQNFGHLIKELTIYALGERYYAIYKLVVEFCSKSLKTLNLIEDEKVKDADKGIQLILTNHFQNLESFDCEYDSEKMKKFIMQHRNLKSIILKNTKDFEHLLPTIAECANELEELEIKVDDDLHMSDAKKTLKKIHTLNYLKKLTIHCPRKKNMTKFIEVLQPCRSLECLQLYDADRSPELIVMLSTLTNLQILRLCNCRNLYDLNPLVKLQQLTEITVTNSEYEMVKLDIVSFVKRLKNLKKLDIDIKCDKQTKDILRSLPEPRPLIYIL